MKKILKNRIFQIAFVAVIVIALVLFCYFNRINENIATRASKVLSAKYYNIECVNEKCEYVAAYKGSKKGKTDVRIINSKGKTVIKYKIDYSKGELKKVPVEATNNYAILAIKDNKDYIHGYSIVNSRGKELLNTETETIFVLTNKLFYSKKDDLYTIYDYTGKALYTDVKDLNMYNNKKILTFVNNEYTIIDENANVILNGYKISEEIKNEDETLYLVIEDNNNVYYYYDIYKNTIVGDSFNSYIKLNNDGKLLITRKINNEVKKYVLTKDGKTKESDLPSKKDILEKLTKNINNEEYVVIEDSIVKENQMGLLVKNLVDNSFGTYDLNNSYYNKLFEFNDNEDKIVIVYNLYEDENNTYLEVGCSANYCKEENIIVYNPVSNDVSFKTSGNDKEIKKYTAYENGYKVITYTDKTNSVFDKENKEVLKTEKQVVVIDEKLIFGDTYKAELLLYSSKEGKTLNDDNSLAILDETSNYKLYKYYDEENMYLYSYEGDFIRKIPIASSSVTFSDKYMLYLENNKANVLNLMNNKAISFDLTSKEFITNSENVVIPPYKGALVISDTNNNTIKIVNYNKKTIKIIKNSTVEKVSFNKENNAIFMIIKQNKKYGLYIIK